jgi:CheY-like chemotaxis protein
VTDSPQKILIVEDSPTMRQLYRMALGGRNSTELLFAVNGVEGLDRLAQEPHLALMIVDINMPQMDGLEFLRRARQDLNATEIPAIVISTEGAESDRIAARDAGASAYLRKPWNPQQLLVSIDVLVRRPEVR